MRVQHEITPKTIQNESVVIGAERYRKTPTMVQRRYPTHATAQRSRDLIQQPWGQGPHPGARQPNAPHATQRAPRAPRPLADVRPGASTEKAHEPSQSPVGAARKGNPEIRGQLVIGKSRAEMGHTQARQRNLCRSKTRFRSGQRLCLGSRSLVGLHGVDRYAYRLGRRALGVLGAVARSARALWPRFWSVGTRTRCCVVSRAGFVTRPGTGRGLPHCPRSCPVPGGQRSSR